MNELHFKARRLAKTYKTTEGELLGVLVEVQKNRLFRELQYPNLFEYIVQELDLGESQAAYFHRVALKSCEVPQLKAAIDTGAITLSEGRRIAPILTVENASEWIEKAATLKQKELERAVTEVNPRAITRDRVVPLTPELSKMTLTIGRETEADFKRAQDLVSQKLGRAATLEDTVAMMTKLFLERHDPVKKAERASRKAKPASSRKPPAATPASHTPIPAESLHAVNLRDQSQCAHVDARGNRCRQRRHLHIHHIIPRSRGGTHDPSDLITLCSGHHRMEHPENRSVWREAARSGGGCHGRGG